MRYLQLNQDSVVTLVPPRRPASATLAVVSAAGTTLSSPAVSLDSFSRTVASVSDFSLVVNAGAGTAVAGRRYWVTGNTGGTFQLRVSDVDGTTLSWNSMPGGTVEAGNTVSGAVLTATVPASVLTVVGTYYQLRWTVTFADGSIQTYLEQAAVCRTVFNPPVTAEAAARHAGFAFPGVAQSRPVEYWDGIAQRASARVERRILASGRFPHLVGDQDMLEDAGFTSLRIELARDGLVPAGFDPSGFVAQMEDELKMQLEYALASNWQDSSQSGTVDVTEMGGPKSIRLERV